jgi:hypothetical protein
MKKYTKEEKEILIRKLLNARRTCKNKRLYLALSHQIEKIKNG